VKRKKLLILLLIIVILNFLTYNSFAQKNEITNIDTSSKSITENKVRHDDVLKETQVNIDRSISIIGVKSQPLTNNNKRRPTADC